MVPRWVIFYFVRSRDIVILFHSSFQIHVPSVQWFPKKKKKKIEILLN